MLIFAIHHATVATSPATGGHVTTISVLAAFVAINTLMYVGLALIKMAPRIRVGHKFQPAYERAETRHINPGLGWVESGRKRPGERLSPR